MSHSTSQLEHPDEFYTPVWDADAKSPIVDGKYEDPKTGELRKATGSAYSGPPAVDLIIMNLHEDTSRCIYRAQRSFAMQKLLCHVVGVIRDRGLEVDSLTATPYAIRVVLAHPLNDEKFGEVTDLMANGIWKQG